MNFVKQSFNSLTGEINHIYTLEEDKSLDPFSIISNRGGVKFHGDLEIEDEGDLAVLAKTLSDAWKLHRQLQPKLTSTLSGH